jgi:hypothetical protein
MSHFPGLPKTHVFIIQIQTIALKRFVANEIFYTVIIIVHCIARQVSLLPSAELEGLLPGWGGIFLKYF